MNGSTSSLQGLGLTDWVGIFGGLVSIIGVAISLWQVRRTKRVARAAQESAAHALAALNRITFLSDISSSVSSIEEVKTLIRSGDYRAAQLRVSDVKARLLQIQGQNSQPAQQGKQAIKRMLPQLDILRQSLEERIHKPTIEIDAVHLIGKLADISDQLHVLVGRARATASTEATHDQS